ncbi:MFS nicotinic acid transporter-like protein Tna1 [Eremomyces bilateralis CBS 781.70]|uniref:MFS nicotinic acid transporter-like protein Tna1 n=1 Tax=Eremomyces bilateralis CBS 781.70 TaxID=1392243 RepID=A0A6G1G8G5_9PEZI|nr:MFS nicotinic acid transporter-like protein Tna1 [Eremomyces bilateralis CBS 781.70]KAF1814395.1 MFS nicotinic acid transporter-like protein Tna1 [Eremomyces bilateralis CBS 781.70]
MKPLKVLNVFARSRTPPLDEGDPISIPSKDEKGNNHDPLPDPDVGLNVEERAQLDKKLVRKLDWKLIPWLSLLYLISFLDRANIGNARIYGLEEDLGMSDTQYSIALTVFFISYSVFEPATNVMLKQFRPRIFIPAIMVVWAIIMTCMGLVQNYGGLLAARFLLGMAEAGLFPGVNYYLSCWYKRSEFGVRAAIFFSAAAFAGSFGGLLAAAIAQMDGVGGKPGWAWIFILEGLASICFGIASYWMVQDFPSDATFLDEKEKLRVLRRLRADKQASSKHEKYHNTFAKQALSDWKTYLFMIIYGGSAGSLYAYSLFLPTIIKEMGYTSTKANLLSVPPYAAAAVLTILVGWHADKTNKRARANTAIPLLAVIGFAMLLGSDNAGVKYTGTYLAALGIYPTISNTITWASNNVEGVFKRGIVLGMVIGWGNLNGIVASNIYKAQDGPRFIVGHSVVLAYIVVFLFGGSVVTAVSLTTENKKRRNGQRDHWVEGKSPDEVEQRGDKRPDFIYVV